MAYTVQLNPILDDHPTFKKNIFRPRSHGNAIVPLHLLSNFWNGQISCSHGNGTTAYQFCLCSDGNAIVSLTCRPFACSDGNGTEQGTEAYRTTFRVAFLVIPLFVTERFYLKRSRLNVTLQLSTFRNNMEQSGTIVFPSERGLTERNASIIIIIIITTSTTSLWSTVQKNMPKNIFNFTLKNLLNSLATRKNLSKWCITQSSACSFCLQSETLQHIVLSCKYYLEQGRYIWRHDSVLNLIANTLSGLQSCSLYADLPAFLSPSLITGDSLRPDLILISNNNDYIYLNSPLDLKQI